MQNNSTVIVLEYFSYSIYCSRKRRWIKHGVLSFWWTSNPNKSQRSVCPWCPSTHCWKTSLLLLWWMLTKSKVGEISWRKCAFAIIGAAAEMWRCIQGVTVSGNQNKNHCLIFHRSTSLPESFWGWICHQWIIVLSKCVHTFECFSYSYSTGSRRRRSRARQWYCWKQ